MNVLDLYSGAEGWSSEFRKRGHTIVTVDNNPRFKSTLCCDVGKLTAAYLRENFGFFDVILASPPCDHFSILKVGHHWRKNEPTPATRQMIELVNYTLGLIWRLNPHYWVMENPRGMLRKAIGRPFTTVTYCQYGERYQKPTDLWGQLPPSFVPKRCNPGDPCHESTPRGATKKGLRGSTRDVAERAKIPKGLSLALCLAAEHDLERVFATQ